MTLFKFVSEIRIDVGNKQTNIIIGGTSLKFNKSDLKKYLTDLCNTNI